MKWVHRMNELKSTLPRVTAPTPVLLFYVLYAFFNWIWISYEKWWQIITAYNTPNSFSIGLVIRWQAWPSTPWTSSSKFPSGLIVYLIVVSEMTNVITWLRFHALFEPIWHARPKESKTAQVLYVSLIILFWRYKELASCV